MKAQKILVKFLVEITLTISTFLCALAQSGTGGIPFDWGNCWEGQCDVPAGLADVTQIGAGGWHSVCLRSDGNVVAWGWNLYGQCNVPNGLETVTQVAAGALHNLALKSNGTVVAWEWNASGQCNVPPGLDEVIAVACGGGHSLALKSDGTVVAWGRDREGECTVPSALTGVVQVAGGGWHSLALKSDGTVVAWGLNDMNQCDVPSGLSGVTQIACGDRHNLARRSDGTVIAWGDNGSGQCNVPPDLTDVVQVSAGEYHSLALKADGTIVTWGLNDYGQCNVPTGITDVVQVAAGKRHSLALSLQFVTVAIDIKPGVSPNEINVEANGLIPVAILSSAIFDAAEVDPTSVEFGPGKAREAHERGHLEDVNHDGERDLVLHFSIENTGIQCGQTEASLIGQTFSGKKIRGKDAMRVVGSRSRKEMAEPTDAATSYTLFQNYPNPFNPTTTICYALPVDAHVSLVVYDMLGQEVLHLIEAPVRAGYHDVGFDASTLASGLYLYRLRARILDPRDLGTQDFVQTKMLLIVR